MTILDQRTDRSGALFIKIASRLEDQNLAGRLADTFFSMERPVGEEPFPVSSADNVRLSRLYFEGQREKIASSEAEALERKISVHEALYGIENGVSLRPAMEKKAAAKVFALLPSVNIASKKELIKAGEDFSESFRSLSGGDRVEFSRNFVKCAEELGAELPEAVRFYAAMGVEQNSCLPEELYMRKVACERAGKDGTAYEKLGEAVRGLTLECADLEKMAEAIHEADVRNGLASRSYDSRLPDAWHIVFRVKEAEESMEEDDKELSKADIVARFGDEALDAVQNEEGEIDRERLKKVMGLFRAGKSGKE